MNVHAWTVSAPVTLSFEQTKIPKQDKHLKHKIDSRKDMNVAPDWASAGLNRQPKHVAQHPTLGLRKLDRLVLQANPDL
jgi:hypothetical protein